MVRSPRVESSVTEAPSAMSGVMVSLAGEAVMRLPATVARLRICGAPTSQAGARQRIGARADEFGGGRVVVRHERAEVE